MGAGQSYNPNAYESVTVRNVSEWVEFDITNLYNEWKSGTPNYGLMLNTRGDGYCVGSQPNGDCAPGYFKSSDHEDAGNRPMLVINP